MNVTEAAAQLGVSPRRVRALIADGRIRAHRVGVGWEIEGLAPSKERRALSVRSWLMLGRAVRSRALVGLSGHDRMRTAERIRRLRESDRPSRLLADWRPADAPAELYLDSLTARANRADDDYIRAALQRGPEYLRSRVDLAEVVASERAIRGESREELAERASVSARLVKSIESSQPLTSPGEVRRVLRALDIEPTALPDMVLS
ncbi:excisionase family DNA-binding protein [Herbiconiux sp. KACC 21604]|uniref:excisionase family DNA-binding protein n=1 Tax=unclassified Herbiconiux TaxID=2618217 RepID=UPI0014921FB6|nr:excisionase family DNA-binding protein [Herbiconiux sp. SALV-R1]QJU52547.1 excisionase family DNA-binding protein [Herbiconiux sp. SALV-R1]WPO87423.1 excisionase family DNA-binding protein [Herbiconiux sp. KACC 21604]